MKVYYEEMLEDRENEYIFKIKQLVKEFNQKMVEKDREFEIIFFEVFSKFIIKVIYIRVKVY